MGHEFLLRHGLEEFSRPQPMKGFEGLGGDCFTSTQSLWAQFMIPGLRAPVSVDFNVAPIGDKLILLWSDLEAAEKDVEHEPIYFTLFDGQRFGESVKFNDKVRNRYAKGAQLGDAFYCVYKCNSQYPKTGYMYHDLALTRIGRDGRFDTTYWADDVKYNSSPDMCRMGDALYAVYGKFEHLYGRREDPARNHGAFWGKITR